MKTDTDPIAEAFRAAFTAVVEPAIDAPSWETFAERASAVEPEPGSRRPGFLRRPVVVVAVAAFAVLFAIGGALLLVGSGSDPAAPADSNPDRLPTTLEISTTLPQVTTTPETAGIVTPPTQPGTAFSWGDDLSEWVTEAEMTDALADVATLHGGTAFDGEAMVEPRGPADDGWMWTAADWSVFVHPWEIDRNDPSAMGPTATNPRLPQGVTYMAEWGFGHGGYILSGPNADQSIGIHLWAPGTSFGYPQGTQVESHEDRVFALASMMLREMGWAD